MQIAVIGAGAIGCLVGGKLAQQGHAVTLVGRPRFAETVQQAGLTIVDDAGVYDQLKLVARFTRL